MGKNTFQEATTLSGQRIRWRQPVWQYDDLPSLVARVRSITVQRTINEANLSAGGWVGRTADGSYVVVDGDHRIGPLAVGFFGNAQDVAIVEVHHMRVKTSDGKKVEVATVKGALLPNLKGLVGKIADLEVGGRLRDGDGFHPCAGGVLTPYGWVTFTMPRMTQVKALCGMLQKPHVTIKKLIP